MFCAIGRAGGKPFWYDEIITLIAAKQPDLASAWKVGVATDANPPLPHLLTHLSIGWFGLNEVTARIPPIVGFWVLSMCLYAFVARRKGPLYGLCALMMPAMTGAYYYAAEARAYGPELGFCGLAMVAWQAAADGRRRAIAIPVLALSLASMVLCHYYAALVFLPLAIGEAIRDRNLRRIDWAIWLAIGAGGAPLVWRATTIVGVVKGFSHTWAPAYLRQGIEFWETQLAPGAAFLALLIALLALCARREPVEDKSEIPDHEWAAAAMLVSVPLVGVAGALLVTHMFNDRYALPGVVGLSLVAPMVAAEFLGRRTRAALVLFGVLAWGMVVRSLDFPSKGNPFEAEPVLRAALEQGPVVIPDGQLFLQMWQYAPEPYKSRLVFLADNAAAYKYMGFETIDDGVRVLKPWASMNVVEYADFARPGREFTAYATAMRPGWLIQRVVADGAHVEIVKTALYRELVRVRLKE